MMASSSSVQRNDKILFQSGSASATHFRILDVSPPVVRDRNGIDRQSLQIHPPSMLVCALEPCYTVSDSGIDYVVLYSYVVPTRMGVGISTIECTVICLSRASNS